MGWFDVSPLGSDDHQEVKEHSYHLPGLVLLCFGGLGVRAQKICALSTFQAHDVALTKVQTALRQAPQKFSIIH